VPTMSSPAIGRCVPSFVVWFTRHRVSI